MEDSSSDDIEIVTAPDKRTRPSAAPSSSSSFDAFARSQDGVRAPRHGSTSMHKTASQQLLLLSDDSPDEGELDLPPPFRATSQQQRPRDVRSASAATRPRQPSIHLATSEDALAAPDDLWAGLPPIAGPSRSHLHGGLPLARSISLTGGASASRTPYESPQLQRAHTLALMNELDSLHASLSSSPFGAHPPRPAQQLQPASSSPALRTMPHLSEDDPFSDLRTPKAVPPPAKVREPALPRPAARTAEKAYDPWADILEPSAKKSKPTKAGAANGGTGKGKEKELEVGEGRKRSLSAAASEEPEGAKRGKISRASAEATTAGLSKTALKKLETADRVKLREANTLRAGDKKVSTAELTMHISGKAFRQHAESDDEAEEEAGRKKRGGGKASARKPSPWLEISREVQKRLKEYNCDVECPDVATTARALDCEGAVRWTRVCDRMWSEERKMYIPLVGDERIVVEEDSRLIFLSALDLSQHVADSTLSTYITTIQSRLPPHVNLFIMLYGLNALARDLERARQEAYRNSIRAAGGGDEAGAGGNKAVKLPGIGERQPSKDDLELALIRLQMQTRCMLVSVDKVADAVDWLEQITFDVGQKPYQRLKHSHIAMLGTSEDKVVSGKDLQDTYIKMLASLPRVTEAMAKGIVAEYPTLRNLYEGYEQCRDERERKEMLVGIGKGHNLNGTTTHRAIGKDMSAYIYRVFWGRDPNMYL
ncbi:hypothetical protein JCM10908_005562 [Rhodotorula pacifica]|uniref:uncharacterized protein n=1 Tax=Rhodotorula pacifica TaxID=1495444 RepID=UPI00316D75FD